MTKIRATRNGDRQHSPVQQERARIIRKNKTDFGRANVAWVVRVAAEDEVSRNGGTLRDALAVLVAQAGSYEDLIITLTKAARRAAKKGRKARRRPSARPVTRFKKIWIVQGGAPGLGGVRKQLKVTTES